jgi:hypothetical protein
MAHTHDIHKEIEYTTYNTNTHTHIHIHTLFSSYRHTLFSTYNIHIHFKHMAHTDNINKEI